MVRIGDDVGLNVRVLDLVITVRNRVGVGVLRLSGEKTLDKSVDDVDGQVGRIEYGMQPNAESVVTM